MFFFYDIENLYEFPTVKNAFFMVVGKKLEADYYCSMEKFVKTSISRIAYRDMLRKTSSPIATLYESAYPSQDEAKRFLADFESEQKEEGREEYQLSMEEAEAVIYWIYHVYGTPNIRKVKTKQAVEAFGKMFEIESLDFAGNILYIKDKVDIIVIDKFADFCEEMEWLEKKNHTFFYRGHANVSYKLLPSIMRSHEWLLHEKDMYNELRIDCAGDFVNCRTHLDYLVEMQHYGLPTRLLDVTKNPLVALYFACENELEETGEIIVFDVENSTIKYPGSDVVSILASLPLLAYKEKTEIMKWIADSKITDAEFNKKATYLLHEIKLEKPAFQNNIKKRDAGRAVFVLSEKKNNRIIKQDGAFIVCGLFGEGNNPINNFRYTCEDKIQIYTITPNGKKQILEQLDKFSVNKATLFPEIEDVANYIKNKYN